MDGGVHGWVANCSIPPARDEAAHEWAPGTHDLYSENPTPMISDLRDLWSGLHGFLD
jgi:hypothetical protein